MRRHQPDRLRWESLTNSPVSRHLGGAVEVVGERAAKVREVAWLAPQHLERVRTGGFGSAHTGAALPTGREVLVDDPIALAEGLPVGRVGRALFTAGEVPQWTEALRQAPGAGLAHASLLFASDAVPHSLRTFVDRVGMQDGVDADAALLAAAGEPAHRLAHALGLASASPLTEAAFLDACSVGEVRAVG